MKKNFLFGAIILLLSSTLQIRANPEGFFAGGQFVIRSFTLSDSNSSKEFSNPTPLAFSLGYQLNFARFVLDYFPEAEYEGEGLVTNIERRLSVIAIRAEYVKYFGDLYLGLGGHMEQVNLTTKFSNGRTQSGPSGLVFGINWAIGYSFDPVSIELTSRRSFTELSKDSLDYKDSGTLGLGVNYHF